MNVNSNSNIVSQTYMRELYGSQQGQGGGRREVAPEAAQVRPGQSAGRDTLFLSAEARRLYQVNRDLNVNENILTQQGDIYRPGLEETVLRSEESFKPQRSEQTEPPAVNQIEAPSSDELRRLEMEVRVNNEAPAQINANEPTAVPERLSASETERSLADRQNFTSEEANINAVNSSNLIQAYAAAANVNQASYTVNYKV
jgi:hypothetical protein